MKSLENFASVPRPVSYLCVELTFELNDRNHKVDARSHLVSVGVSQTPERVIV